MKPWLIVLVTLGTAYLMLSKKKFNLSGNPNIVMPLKKVIKEHERLVKTLREGKTADLKRELRYQAKELEEYKAL